MSTSTSRKLILASAAFVMTAAISAPAFAYGGHGGRLGAAPSRTFTHVPSRHVGRLHPHGHPHWYPHFHYHRVFVGGRWIVRPVGYVEPVVTAAPGPCTCLTKEYTPDGQVVFKDLCTKEMASAPVAGAEPQKSSEIQSPTNFAGKTYQDYLAATGGQQQN